MRSVASRVSNVQYAALPWRNNNGVVEVLLVTTLSTRRWIVPKGWPLAGKSPSQCAAHEAMEEAGLLGEIAEAPLGSFHYDKRRKSGETVLCRVHVFPMEVTRQRRSWAEKPLRQTCWCTLDDALARVKEPGLRRVIARFAKCQTTATSRKLSVRSASTF